MIAVAEAKKLIKEKITHLDPRVLPIDQAGGLILSTDIYAKINIPSYPQSSMDGYAIKFDDGNQSLTVIGEMAAGTGQRLSISAGQATSIFTGAPLPEGADTVVMQERVVLEGSTISFQNDGLKMGSNVRLPGAEVQSGQLALEKNTLLNPAALAFLAGIGQSNVEVYPMPKVAIILTGNELQQPGKHLNFGQVYEANSYSLRSALKQQGVENIRLFQAGDDLKILTEVLNTALIDYDLVLITGGVSVGKYDFVLQAVEICGVETIFHKVKQKPGKPLFFGMKDKKVILGLPGNPSSVLSCYYHYVTLAIKQLSKNERTINQRKAVLSHDYYKPAGLTHFLKGNYKNGEATELGAQESFRLSSFAHANCLIELAEDQCEFKAGETVPITLLF